MVCQLIKFLYGLKQAPRAWYFKLDQYLRDFGFKKVILNPLSVSKIVVMTLIILIVYVNDLAITGSNVDMIQQVKSDICFVFEMINLGLLHYCLDIEFWQFDHTIFVSQVKYVIDLLEKFKMIECDPTFTPREVRINLSTYTDSPLINESFYRQLVGSLIYLTTTRPNLCFAVSCLSRLMSKPQEVH
jgi:hypothetical protein